MAVSHRLNERVVTSFVCPFVCSFIHSKQKAVVMSGLLITDSPSRSKLQIPSLTKHRCSLETHTSSVADAIGTVIISL